jgi:hypothetical protein
MSDNNDNEWQTVNKKKAPSKNDHVTFDHQNWETTIIHGKNAATTTGPKQIVNKNVNPEAIKMAKIANSDDIIKLKNLSIDARQELVKGRVAKGYNQEKLAQALCIPVNLYKDIENGKTIPQQNVLTKINIFLGTRAKLT